MPPKKESKKKKRVRRAPKKGLKQKQKQRQVVNVQVSSGGGGSGGFIPIPQAPSIDYSLLSNLLRPANTVDVPMRASAPMMEPLPARAAEEPSFASSMPKSGASKAPSNPFAEAEIIPSTKGRKVRKDAGISRGRSGSPMPAPESGGEFERMIEAQKSGSFM